MLQPEPSAHSSATAEDALKAQQGSEIRKLLDASSRTFALTIPMLPGGLQQSVELAYLLLRAADAIEDATQRPLTERMDLLGTFAMVLRHETGNEAFSEACTNFAIKLPPGGERSVLANMELLFAALDRESPQASETICFHCERVVQRMRAWLNAGTTGSQLKLEDFGELSDYMYSVAGIVGELLTDLFVLQDEGCPRLSLMARASDFGAALQLTNIIKDSGEDSREGRQFLPEAWFFIDQPDGLARLLALVELAELRLHTAIDYICLLPEKQNELRLFCLAPVVLALASLEALVRRSDETLAGDKVKIERAEVPNLLLQAKTAVSSNQAVRLLHEKLTRQIDEARRGCKP